MFTAGTGHLVVLLFTRQKGLQAKGNENSTECYHLQEPWATRSITDLEQLGSPVTFVSFRGVWLYTFHRIEYRRHKNFLIQHLDANHAVKWQRLSSTGGIHGTSEGSILGELHWKFDWNFKVKHGANTVFYNFFCPLVSLWHLWMPCWMPCWWGHFCCIDQPFNLLQLEAKWLRNDVSTQDSCCNTRQHTLAGGGATQLKHITDIFLNPNYKGWKRTIPASNNTLSKDSVFTTFLLTSTVSNFQCFSPCPTQTFSMQPRFCFQRNEGHTNSERSKSMATVSPERFGVATGKGFLLTNPWWLESWTKDEKGTSHPTPNSSSKMA